MVYNDDFPLAADYVIRKDSMVGTGVDLWTPYYKGEIITGGPGNVPYQTKEEAITAIEYHKSIMGFVPKYVVEYYDEEGNCVLTPPRATTYKVSEPLPTIKPGTDVPSVVLVLFLVGIVFTCLLAAMS